MSRVMRDAARGAAARLPSADVRARRHAIAPWLLQLTVIAAHMPFAVFVPRYSKAYTVTALAVLALGCVAALVPRRPELVAYAAAYCVGAEVLWRMRTTASDVPWEFAKYSISLMLLIAVIVRARPRSPALPLAYLLLLLPGALVTILTEPWEFARSALSFNFTGPVALGISVLFFSSIRLNAAQVRWLLTCLVAPIAGIAMIALTRLNLLTRTTGVTFTGAANRDASGGFGPNQVGAVLGLGIVAAVLYLIVAPRNRKMTAGMIALILLLVRQCLLTFSRAGIYMAGLSILAAGFYLFRARGARVQVMTTAALVGAIIMAVILPRLEELTGGALATRFEDTGGSGRGLLIKADLETWSTSPILGVGVGLGGEERLKYFYTRSVHTEYTRMVAEHGLLGLGALIVLGLIARRSLRRQKNPRGKALSAAFLVYALLFMAVNATRLAAPSFAFGAAAILFASSRDTTPPRRSRSVATSLRTPWGAA
jgi:hypothetical protein